MNRIPAAATSRPFRALLLVPVLALPFAACAKKAGAPPKETVPVVVADVVTRPMPVEERVVGHVEPIESVAVRPRVGGILEKVHFREGDEVAAGQLLFTLDRAPLEETLRQAEAILARDRAQASDAEANAKRYAELATKDYVTKQQADQTRAQADSAAATVRADEAAVANARLQLDYATIRAPGAGRTGGLLVQVGNLVKASDDKPLVVINRLRPIYVVFPVPEKDLTEITRRMRTGRLSVSAAPADAPELVRTGLLTFVDNAVDRATGTVLLKATFPNEDHVLWPGRFLNVALTLATEANAIVVPSEAIQTGQQGQTLYVAKEDGTAELRKVVVARELTVDGRPLSVVASGVRAGEKVIVDGQLRLVPGSKIEPRSAGEAPKPASSAAGKAS